MVRLTALLTLTLMLPAWALAQEPTQEQERKAREKRQTQEQDQWLGPEKPSSRLTLAYGRDETEYRVGTLGLTVPLNSGNRISLTADRGRTRDDGLVEYYRAGISSDPLADQVVRLDGIVRNNPDTSAREAQLQGRRYLGDWDLGLRLRGGRVTFDDPEQGEEQKGVRGGLGLGLGYLAGPFYFSLDGIQYAYNWEDQEPQAGSNNQGLLSFIGSDGSSGGSRREPILNKREATAMVSVATGPFDWQLGGQRIEDTVGETRDIALLGASYETPGGHSVGLNLDIPRDNEPAFAQIVLGIRL
ncbi:MAG: hypothetical protein R3296_00770 [Oleiphilaceae bacterium]|nr:hypothetical protein [Oleiphilaceae bacterium]